LEEVKKQVEQILKRFMPQVQCKHIPGDIDMKFYLTNNVFKLEI